MDTQKIEINGMSIEIPDYYQKVDSMPEDPENSAPYMTQTETAICFALIYPIEISKAMPRDKEEVIRSIHHFLTDKQGLIQVESDSDSVYSIVKTLKEPTGVIYTLTYQRFFSEGVLNIQAFFEESGTTGIRDSIVYELCRKENLVGSDDNPFVGWMKDPYDEDYTAGALMNLSEQERFDEMFPESPLSMCREFVKCLEVNNNPNDKMNNDTTQNNDDSTETIPASVLTDIPNEIINISYDQTKDEKLSTAKSTCDKYDYIIAACCGGLAGVIDAIFVEDPSSSKLGDAVDKSADGFVKRAAQFFWKNDKRKEGKSKKMPESLNKCVSYLEQAFPVNYDARYASDLIVEEGILDGMGPKNHHLYSLAHSPDIIGLIFSIIDQYSSDGSASFIDKGHIIHVVPKKTSGAVPYLSGSDHTSKLFCGFVNWIGHMLSDLVGSSSTRQAGKTGRGMGLPMPFFNMFLRCDFGDFNGKTLAETMIQVYEKGYDLRFGIATSIPLLIEELMIRAIWVIRQKFLRKKEWKECMPSAKHDDLRIMLLVGNGAFCLVDGADAAIHGVKNQGWVSFVCHLNIAGWTRFTILVIKEVAMRMRIMIADQSDPFMEKIFGKLSDEDKQKITKFVSVAKELLNARDYMKTLQDSLKEHKLAREERIRIEAECRVSIAKIQQYRLEMTDSVEHILEDYMLAFGTGFDLMDSGIKENDGEKFIQGNVLIQNKLGYDVQFSNGDEFDTLMDDDNEAFKL